MLKKTSLVFIFLLFVSLLKAQVQLGDSMMLDYDTPKEYEIGGITVSGVQFLDEGVLLTLTGLAVGDKIKVPGDKITQAIENLWKQGLLTDVKVRAVKITGGKIFLDFQLQERPRLSKFTFEGIKRGEADKLREKLQLVKGKVLTENLIQSTKNQVQKYFVEKGFLFTEVNVETERDTTAPNSELMRIKVTNKRRIKINEINITGNHEFSSRKIQRKMKGTKSKGFLKFVTSKYNAEAFEEDKQKITDAYQSKGFRDARVVSDSVYRYNNKSVNIDMTIDEGHKYYFRNITWVGNTKYSSTQLGQILAINKGDVYNQKKLDEGLSLNQNGRDVSSLYMDDGYLFFQVNPVEVQVDGDSIDMEMRVYEGKQAIINHVTVKGNTKTNDKVILREIRTQPGQLFSRSDIIRTQRELAQLGYFDQEKLAVNPKPNPADGTVDIEYVVDERPSDQLELSGGWGAGQVVGTLGLKFSNFSARNIFNKKSYTPLPSGDGQQLSLRFQSNGLQYQSYNASFTEPWLGGKKPNSLTFSVYRSVQSNGLKRSNENRADIQITGVSVGLGRRLKWPDDYFNIYHEVSLQHYDLNNYTTSFLFSNGSSNNLNFQQTISRNSVDGFIWIRSGSQISFTVQATPPFSLFNKTDYSTATDQVKYRWIEYHKWKFSGSWFKSLGSKFVVNARTNFGFLGFYNKKIGQSPFERFYLGGDGLSGFSLDGREIIALRGYENNTITPRNNVTYIGGTAYDKFTLELRFPVSLNPQATIYTLGFIEGGNNWLKFKDFNPYDMKRSAGVGFRIFLPMFGLLGLDWGYGFDKVKNLPGVQGGHFHFTIGQQF